MERYERFMDALLAVIVVALICTNVWTVVYVALSVELGLLSAFGLLGSGVTLGAIIRYYAGLRSSGKDPEEVADVSSL